MPGPRPAVGASQGSVLGAGEPFVVAASAYVPNGGFHPVGCSAGGTPRRILGITVPRVSAAFARLMVQFIAWMFVCFRNCMHVVFLDVWTNIIHEKHVRFETSSWFDETVARPLTYHIHDLEIRESGLHRYLEASHALIVLLPNPILLEVPVTFRGLPFGDPDLIGVPVPFDGFALGASDWFLLRTGYPLMFAHDAMTPVHGLVPGIGTAFGTLEGFLRASLPFESASFALFHRTRVLFPEWIGYSETGSAFGTCAVEGVEGLVFVDIIHWNHCPFVLFGSLIEFYTIS